MMNDVVGTDRLDGSQQSSSTLKTHSQPKRQSLPNNFTEHSSPPISSRNSSIPFVLLPSYMTHPKQISPVPVKPLRSTVHVSTIDSSQYQQQRNSPVLSRQLTTTQDILQVQQQIQILNLHQNSVQNSKLSSYSPKFTPPVTSSPSPLLSYTIYSRSRQSPTHSQSNCNKCLPSGTGFGTSEIKSSLVSTFVPISMTPSTCPLTATRSTPLHARDARQTKVQPVVFIKPVRSIQDPQKIFQIVATSTSSTVTTSSSPPSYACSIQQKRNTQYQRSAFQGCPSLESTPSVPTTKPPSYAKTMQARATQCNLTAVQPLISSCSNEDASNNNNNYSVQTLLENDVLLSKSMLPSPLTYLVMRKKLSPFKSLSNSTGSLDNLCGSTPPSTNFFTTVNDVSNELDKRFYKIDHQSPIPKRKYGNEEKEEQQKDCKIQRYSSQAFKFFIEQHIENIVKSHKQRLFRRVQLETEMAKMELSAAAQCQIRKMLSQKESNYIRLKRARINKSMFIKIKLIGFGAFGEVVLVRKIDTHHLYAMKILRKSDVLKRNQVAHVKAERDILAEADNEWVVKLYYSFQDKDNLYFVMDYIPGGDLMSLLIKFGLFDELLAKFYLAELICAVESVHKMGFIHRDVKPDNILIDRDGHIKLTDFGLCTGFRWTHNSKYYQNNEHNQQGSFESNEKWTNGVNCKCYQLKPLERRKREQHQRCLAHSIVGTPNYIAPEVLLQTGYTQLCDWWSVGVILYEMLVGSPPFLASTPNETQHKVINWKSTLHIPASANISVESTDLILKLCTSADKRLGKNANEIKEHKFFSSIDFGKGIRKCPPPYIPRIQYATDTSNFDSIDSDKLRCSMSSDKLDQLTDENGLFHGFFEFTFRRFFDDVGGVPFPARINLGDNNNQGAIYV